MIFLTSEIIFLTETGGFNKKKEEIRIFEV